MYFFFNIFQQNSVWVVFFFSLSLSRRRWQKTKKNLSTSLFKIINSLLRVCIYHAFSLGFEFILFFFFFRFRALRQFYRFFYDLCFFFCPRTTFWPDLFLRPKTLYTVYLFHRILMILSRRSFLVFFFYYYYSFVVFLAMGERRNNVGFCYFRFMLLLSLFSRK